MILTKNYIIEGNILRKGTQITLKESVDNITDEAEYNVEARII